MSQVPITVVTILLITLTTHVSAAPENCDESCECIARPGGALMFVACRSADLSSIPRVLPRETVHLVIQNANIQTLEEGAFSHLPRLEHVELLNCNLRNIKPGAFKGLQNLERITIRDHKMRYIETNSFDGIVQPLSELTLTGKTIDRIHDGAFLGLNITGSLKLQGNPISHISNIAFQGSKVKKLYLTNSSLPSGPLQWLSHLKQSLKTLSINSNQQRLEIPHNQFRGFMFEELNLAKNRINDIKFLTSVHTSTLILDNNPIGPVDLTNFPDLYRLKTLSMKHTQFRKIDANNFIDLNNLKTLYLSGNGITTFPETMRPVFDRLDLLVLEHNPLHCNCDIKWLKTWVITTSTRVVGAVCQTPKTVELAKFPALNMTCKAPSSVEIEETYNRNANMVILKCISRGDPPPSITWETPDGTSKLTPAPVDVSLSSAYGVLGKDNDENVEGEYICHAHSKHGSVTRTHNVTMYKAHLEGANASSAQSLSITSVLYSLSLISLIFISL